MHACVEVCMCLMHVCMVNTYPEQEWNVPDVWNIMDIENVTSLKKIQEK